MTEAAIYIDNVQRRVTRKPKEKIERKTESIYLFYMLSSICDLMVIIYIDGEFNENALMGFQIIQ